MKKNKGYKIPNYGKIFDNSSRRRKKRIRNTVIFVLVALLLVFLGYSISGPLVNLLNGKKTERPSESSSNHSSQPQEIISSIPEEEKKPEISSSQLNLAYLPIETAKDTTKLTEYLQNLKNLGYNSVVLELKDEAGNIFYNTANQMAIDVGAVNASAILNISETVTVIKNEGLIPVANINAFKDVLATKKADAKIKYTEHEGWSWFDAANGKPWLNPYSETAQGYIISLATELVDLGFMDVMVSSVMFPNVNSFVSADFGELETTISHGDILERFTEKLKTALNDKGARFILDYDATQASNSANVIYGTKNPISFFADIYEPSFVLSADSGAELAVKLGEIKAQYPTKIVMAKFLSTDKNAVPLTAEQIKAQKNVCQGYSVFLCDKSGNYLI